MRHASEGVLRARVDGELSAADRTAVEQHLQTCERCRRRAEEMAAGAQAVDALLAAQVGEAVPDAVRAFARLESRLREARRPSFREMFLGRMRAPAWAAVAAVAVLILLVTSSSSRVAARKLLGIFRAKTVVALPLEHDFTANGRGQLISDLLASSVTVTLDEKRQTVADREEASRLAGFPVRLPASRSDAPRILRVEGANAFHLTVDRQRVESFLELVNRLDIPLPREYAGARVTVEIPRGVTAVYGECPDVPRAVAEPARLVGCLDLAEVPSATVTTVPELNLAQLAEIGLQVSGMTQAQAESFSRTIDWTSTMAIALPRECTTYENVTVEGQKGVFIIGRQYANWPTRWALIWVRDERVYRLAGFGNPESAIRVAESLQ